MYNAHTRDPYPTYLFLFSLISTKPLILQNIKMLAKDLIKYKAQQQAARADVVIGIDPDAEKNGIAYFERASKHLQTQALSFPDTLDYLRYVHSQAKAAGRSLIVIIEAGWLNKSHWHLTPFDTRQKCAKIGNDVGRNHETGRKIAEMCQHWEIPHYETKPLSLKIAKMNLWSGKEGKITAKELEEVTGLKGRTNQEERDAALLAWVWAGEGVEYPNLRISTKK